MPDSRKSDLLLVITTLLAAISWMFSKEAVLLMPPLMFMAGRFLIAGCGLIFTALIVNRWNALSKALKDALRKRKSSPQNS